MAKRAALPLESEVGRLQSDDLVNRIELYVEAIDTFAGSHTRTLR